MSSEGKHMIGGVGFTISQSMMKDYESYRAGEYCGILFEAAYIEKRCGFIQGEAQMLGDYFEYKATGQRPRSGKEPQADYKRGKNGIKELTAPYARANRQAKRFKKYAEELGMEIVATGVKIGPGTQEGKEFFDLDAINAHPVKRGCTMIVDALIRFDVKKLQEHEPEWARYITFNNIDLMILDLKYSGLLENKYEDFGWALENINYRPKLRIQPIHYSWMSGLPFMWWVFSSSADEDNRLMFTHIDDDEFGLHEKAVVKMRRQVQAQRQLRHGGASGFKAYPSVRRCEGCQLFDECTYKKTAPKIHEVYLGVEA